MVRLLAASPAAATWRAGTARENITPPAGVWMTGYAARDRPAEGTAQDLWVKALAFSDPAGNRGVLLTLDLCGISREVSEHAAAELMKRFQLPRSAIMTNVSHTHCSPMLNANRPAIRILPPDGLAKSIAYARAGAEDGPRRRRRPRRAHPGHDFVGRGRGEVRLQPS